MPRHPEIPARSLAALRALLPWGVLWVACSAGCTPRRPVAAEDGAVATPDVAAPGRDSAAALDARRPPDRGRPPLDLLPPDSRPAHKPGWPFVAGGAGHDALNDVALDARGNVYVGGYYSMTVYFGDVLLPPSAGNIHGLVARLSPAGAVEWVSAFPATDCVWVEAVAADSAGGCVVGGFFHGAATFGSFSVETKPGKSNTAFVAHLDTSGKVDWVQVDEGPAARSYVRDLAVDSKGNVHFAGNTLKGSARMGGASSAAHGWEDILVGSASSRGKVRWLVGWGGPDYDEAHGVAVDGAGDIYVTGYIYNTVTFGTTTLTGSGIDLFVTRLDTGGKNRWIAHSTGDTAIGQKIHVDSSGTSHVAARIMQTNRFGPHTLTSSGGVDMGVVRVNASGKFIGATRVGGRTHETVVDLVPVKGGGYVLAGYFQEWGYFDLASCRVIDHSQSHGLVALRLDGKGKLTQVTCPGDGQATGVALDPGGRAFLVGAFSGSAGFGSAVRYAAGKTDMAVWRW